MSASAFKRVVLPTTCIPVAPRDAQASADHGWAKGSARSSRLGVRQSRRHFGMVVGAILPATLLPDARRRQLASNLAALGQTPPSEPQARTTWAETIQAAAKFAAAYRWRMAWGVALTSGLLAALLWGLGRLYPHVFLTDWAYLARIIHKNSSFLA